MSNNFERCVGGLIVPEDTKGRVLILPQISKKPEAIVTLLREVLPDLSPHLFPHIEGSPWVEREEYELDSVLNKIVKYWDKIGVVGVQISENKLHKGERIGYVTPEGYLEEEALSLHYEY